MPKKIIIHSGTIIGNWTVIEEEIGISKHTFYKCLCKCGKIKIVRASVLKYERSKKCKSCAAKINIIKRSNFISIKKCTHGRSKTREYEIWSGMLKRCNNPKCTRFKDYGGRGIKVCKRWLKFENFFKDMGLAPDHLQIDRINNDGNYEPGNCRWVTPKENCNNKRANKNKNRGILTASANELKENE